MLLENIGKLCFGRTRPFLFFALLSTPLFLVGIYLYMHHLELLRLQENFQTALENGKQALERKAFKERFLNHYSQADPYFIDQQIESLSFLEKEQKEIRALIKHPAMLKTNPFLERLQFLVSEENKLSFAEQNIRSSSQIKETEEKQQRAIQVDEEDLKRILSAIEGVPVEGYSPFSHSPQLLIQNFQLRKHTTAIETEVFLLEMSLVKREFFP